ncbi:MAG: flagella basal body P-ring formation protein FlgA [Deltaproteobacteria bacterium]|nr:flagella basal body P-ring formation protein FlgA [Deltaproteobacteria bacterium]
MKTSAVLVAFACLVVSSGEVRARPRAAETEAPRDGVRRVEVTGPRLRLGDLVEGLGALADVDLGPSPAPGVSRLLRRDELRAELEAQGISSVPRLPEAVRVSRRLERVTSARLQALLLDAVRGAGLRDGIVLRRAEAPANLKVASGWQRVSAMVPRPPRRPGEWSTTVTLAFELDGQKLARVAVPAVFDVSPEAAAPDLAKGGPVTLVVKNGLVEIAARASAGDNADVGDVIPVTVSATGKVVRAKLVTKDRAVLEGRRP